MPAITLETVTPEETSQVGRLLAHSLRPGDVVALIGPLGAGKTQLTRGIAAGLGADPRKVASPTFILMTEYEAPTPLVHIDAYRIHSLADLESIGFTDELLRQSITVIEWADRIAQDLPPDHLRIDLSHTEGGRQVTITSPRDLPALQSQISNLKSPTPSHPCRTCGRDVDPDAPTFPFCSHRCRLVDLNRWFKGDYSLSRPLDDNEDSATSS